MWCPVSMTSVLTISFRPLYCRVSVSCCGMVWLKCQVPSMLLICIILSTICVQCCRDVHGCLMSHASDVVVGHRDVAHLLGGLVVWSCRLGQCLYISCGFTYYLSLSLASSSSSSLAILLCADLHDFDNK